MSDTNAPAVDYVKTSATKEEAKATSWARAKLPWVIGLVVAFVLGCYVGAHL